MEKYMKESATVKNEVQRILIFNLAGEDLALDISCVREVLKPQKIHPLQNAPEFIEGLIDLRGHIIVAMDLRKKFNIEPLSDRPLMRIIICVVKSFIVGLIVDSVSEVVNLSDVNIMLAPQAASVRFGDNYVAGIVRLGQRVVTLLDLEKILTTETLEKLSEMRK
jgi:purine-binding chemotaxis protein CheW